MSRRNSLLDAGGAGSINNFASSVQRSVDYLSKSFDSKLNSPIHDTVQENDGEQTIDTIIDEVEDYIPNYGSTREPINSDAVSISDSIKDIVQNIRHNNISRSNSIHESIGGPVMISLKSTPTQTIFNSVNVLIGLGILSIPLALHLSGWVIGIITLLFASISTKQTAVLLGRILEKYPQLQTYQDIGIFCYGNNIGFIILIIFTLDLIGAGISMILLFADSINAIIPSIPQFELKVFICSLLVILNFLPLRLLSFLSLLGIICTTCTCFAILIAGLSKTVSPGSLLTPMETNLFPNSLKNVFFSFGLFMAPWGGHATFPEIFKDQLKPSKFNKCMNISFTFSFMMDFLTGVFGFLMFGNNVEDEITKNILINEDYPIWISQLIVILMSILPISKLPLISRPIVTILDNKINNKLINRILLSLVFLIATTMLTNFGKVMSLLGSLICFTVCLTLPCLYYLHTFPEIPIREKIVWWIMVVIGIVGAIGGTIAVIKI